MCIANDFAIQKKAGKTLGMELTATKYAALSRGQDTHIYCANEVDC